MQVFQLWLFYQLCMSKVKVSLGIEHTYKSNPVVLSHRMSGQWHVAVALYPYVSSSDTPLWEGYVE